MNILMFFLLGIGPAVATPPLLERFGLKKEDIDIYELNEGEFHVL